jgi:L-ascorbate metabolism protein UlaG (beta-lactamase superfamily)
MSPGSRGFGLTWLGHNSFKLVTRDGRTVLIDPWVEGNPACPQELKRFDRIDVMTISHGHGDHMADAVTLGKKFGPTIVCNYEIHLFLSKKGVTKTSPMNKGGSQEVAGLRFTMVNALHSSGIEDGGQVVYGGEPCGFVITLEDGTRIYHAGDTGVFGDMALIRELYAPDIALLPIGDLYTMSPREAAVATRMLQPQLVIPSHYGTFPALTGTPEALRAELAKLGVDVEVVALKPGETLR